MGEFSGQVAFITGAAHGQGRAVALALAQEGARIVAFDVARQLSYPGYALGSTADLDSLVAAVAQLGSDCLSCPGDVRDDAASSLRWRRLLRASTGSISCSTTLALLPMAWPTS